MLEQWKTEVDSTPEQHVTETLKNKLRQLISFNRQGTLAYSNSHMARMFYHHHQSLNHMGHWGTKDNFATSFLHFSLFSTALWDLANLRSLHSLMLSAHLFFSFLSALSSSPFRCALQDGFGQT